MNKIKNIFTITFVCLFFAACSMQGSGNESSVSYKLDSETVQNIKAAAEESIRNSNARAADVNELFIEVSVHGEYEDSITEPVEEDQTIVLKGIPKGVEIYVEAIAYSNVNGKRKDLYKGHSKTFTIQYKENMVMFIMKKMTDYVLYVANTQNNGSSQNNGKEAQPLDSIESAVARIISLIKSDKADKTKTWTIKLLSDMPDEQVVSGVLNGYAEGLIITSKDSENIKTIGSDSSNIGFQILTTVPVTIKNLKITSGMCGVCIGDVPGRRICAATLIMENGTVGGSGIGVNISAGGTFKMRGGTVNCYGNDPSMDSGIYIEDRSSKFFISGDSVINTYIPWDGDFTPICIDGPLTGTTPVATIYNRSSFNVGAQVLTTANGVKLSDVLPKFSVYGSYKLDGDGKLAAN